MVRASVRNFEPVGGGLSPSIFSVNDRYLTGKRSNKSQRISPKKKFGSPYGQVTEEVTRVRYSVK